MYLDLSYLSFLIKPTKYIHWSKFNSPAYTTMSRWGFKSHCLPVSWLNVLKIKKVIILEAQWAKPLSLTCHFVLRKLYTEHSIGVSYQYQLTWPTGIREDLKKKTITNKNCIWQPYQHNIWKCILPCLHINPLYFHYSEQIHVVYFI